MRARYRKLVFLPLYCLHQILWHRDKRHRFFIFTIHSSTFWYLSKINNILHFLFIRKKIVSDVPYHYYEVNDMKECQFYLKGENSKKISHKFMTEKAVFARWATTHNLSFHHPRWKNIAVNSASKLDSSFLHLYKYKPSRRKQFQRQIRKQLMKIRNVNQIKIKNQPKKKNKN